MKFSHNIDPSELPSYNTIKDLHMFNSVRCSDQKNICQPLTTLVSYEFKPLDASNFENGLIYRGGSEPVYDEELKKYYTFDLIHQLKCKPDKISPTPSAIVSFDDDSNEMLIYLQYNTAFGCPMSNYPTPAPTPSFSPDCKFVFRSKENREIGLQFDLKEFNGGPGGLYIHMDDKSLFYQPCERIECPGIILDNYTCTSPSQYNEEKVYSSAWLCDNNDYRCEDFGLANNSIKAVLVNEDDLNQGIEVPLLSNNNKIISIIIN